MSQAKRQTKISEVLDLGSESRAKMTASLEPRRVHGGPASQGRRKTKRPYFSTTPLHFVLSSSRAKGQWALSHRKHSSRISAQIYTYAKRFKVRIYQSRIEGGQIELLLKAGDRKGLADFLRVLAGRVAIQVSGAKKGVKRVGKFWNELCWSKLINWGREFYQVHHRLKAHLSLNKQRDEEANPLQAVLIPLIPGS